ncbi:hypothetical protein [Cohnella rhizosphaerae]|uniref:Uncharacterized protein n=1 Tax=Cohnella rhizosphaerae TaxID=1457232 RepID=A0A9X4KRZ5_9BACL|nr:hypothetical protein [Cohnella rhizosphaerae]MDG0809747.1 hypothetical protein [Cohnella rhizosphaerae]
MPTIANFPQDLLEEHMNWHHAHHVDDPSQLRPGYGAEFLQFHRGFIRRALDWYGRQHYDMSLVAPWQRVPEEIRRAPCYDRSAEARIVMQPQSFRTADELGLFIEGSGLHGCIHETAADLYGEPDINDFDVAPRNTVFYNIHGMIDGWYRNWEAAGRVNQGMLEWGGPVRDGCGRAGGCGRDGGAAPVRAGERSLVAGARYGRNLGQRDPFAPPCELAAYRRRRRAGREAGRTFPARVGYGWRRTKRGAVLQLARREVAGRQAECRQAGLAGNKAVVKKSAAPERVGSGAALLWRRAGRGPNGTVWSGCAACWP